MITLEQIPRLQSAASRYFQVTDDVEAMHFAEVLFTIVDKDEEGIEAMIKFYEEEDQ